jgi:hypothetical protein
MTELREDELWLSCDPGESVGWALWRGSTLIDAGTGVLWDFAQSVFVAVFRPEEAELIGDWLAEKFIGITRIVMEDWRIYPREAKKGTLDWDQCRTARLIGALTLICQQGSMEYVLQPALIKEAAEQAGAEAFFLSPRDENRHANDAIRHGVYYTSVKQGLKPVNEVDYSKILLPGETPDVFAL